MRRLTQSGYNHRCMLQKLAWILGEAVYEPHVRQAIAAQLHAIRMLMERVVSHLL